MGALKLQTRGRDVVGLCTARTWEAAFELIARVRAEASDYGYKLYQARISQRKLSGRRCNLGLILIEVGGMPLAEMAELEEWLAPITEKAGRGEEGTTP